MVRPMSEEPGPDVQAIVLRCPPQVHKYGIWTLAHRGLERGYDGWSLAGSDEDPLWDEMQRHYEGWWPIDISAVTEGEATVWLDQPSP